MAWYKNCVKKEREFDINLDLENDLKANLGLGPLFLNLSFPAQCGLVTATWTATSILNFLKESELYREDWAMGMMSCDQGYLKFYYIFFFHFVFQAQGDQDEADGDFSAINIACTETFMESFFEQVTFKSDTKSSVAMFHSSKSLK